ncbi:MAG: hypothetical protein CVV10_09240 [Gammaproteobacteria bacterium HGW-Gammaproteobacteria-14]|nr:MAG: hypothetical protein CVV10_09240 [Gammaproteobacteria bacterium HGW-Gammaproteobacteria-14]
MGTEGATLMTESDQGRLLLPGQRLSQAREAMGLSHAAVAERMHLSVSYIKALEADDYKRLPEPAFVRGYIKNYARIVSLPGDELANLFQQMIEETSPPQESAVSQKKSAFDYVGNGYARYALLGGVLLLLLWSLWPSSEPITASAPAMPVIDVEQAGEDHDGSGENYDSADDDSAIDLDTTPSSDVGSVTGVASNSAAEAAVATLRPDVLVVRFAEDCWLRVRDAEGEEVYVGQRSAGQTLTLEGQGPFRLTLGNAAAVSAIQVNDASVRVPVVAAGQVITVRAP